MLVTKGSVFDRLGRARILKPNSRKIRIWDYFYLQDANKKYIAASVKNYKITLQQKDELIKECQNLLGENESVKLNEDSIIRILHKIRSMIHKSIPGSDSVKGSLEINRDYPVDVFEIRLNCKPGSCDSACRPLIMIPIDYKTSGVMVEKRTINPKILQTLRDKGLPDADIVELVQSIRDQDPKANLTDAVKAIVKGI